MDSCAKKGGVLKVEKIPKIARESFFWDCLCTLHMGGILHGSMRDVFVLLQNTFSLSAREGQAKCDLYIKLGH